MIVLKISEVPQVNTIYVNIKPDYITANVEFS